MTKEIRGVTKIIPLSKSCFKCGEHKPITEYYKHPQMADGHLGKCKSCAKSDVNGNRKVKLDYYQQYDRLRFQTPERKAKHLVYSKLQREREPGKRAARLAVGYAIKSGKLIKQPCEKCGNTKVEAHHDDYSRPLEVRWLCKIHHMEHHWGAAA
jgi:ribosomal protein S27AE